MTFRKKSLPLNRRTTLAFVLVLVYLRLPEVKKLWK
jgi:hypothetical protein